MKYLWFFMVCWKHRNTPYYEFFEQYTLVLKAARRCAYDLNHCASDVSMLTKDGEKPLFDYHERSQMWQKIFSPTGGKDYRHKMHYAIWDLESKVKEAKKLLDENGIKHHLDEVPF